MPWVIEIVMIKREAALQAAGNLGMRPLPVAPFGERPDGWQIVASGQLLEKKVGERCRGLTNNDAWMPTSFD